MILASGLVFELPLIMFFLGKLGMVRAAKLRKLRPVALVIAFTVAAFITPADVFTQIAVGIPLFLLYELGILLVRWVEPEADEPRPRWLEAEADETVEESPSGES